MGNYEFFKKEFEFHGKHARMAGELWVKGDYEHTYFRRLIDLYMVAAVVGYICIKTMLVIVKKRKFTYFSIYCLVVGILSIIGYFVTA